MASCSRFLSRTLKSTDVARMFPLFQGPNGRIAISFVLFLIFFSFDFLMEFGFFSNLLTEYVVTL